jgi:bla regulator protein BlaR1
MARIFLALSLLLPWALFGQAPEAPAFTVASIKPNKSNDDRFMLRPLRGGGLTATGVTLKMLISFAYGVAAYQISGAPSWIGTERWDIEAKTDGEAKTEGVEARVSLAESQARLRHLLEDRFQLKTRRQSKKLPVYALVVTKGGFKLRPNAVNTTERKPQVNFRLGAASFTNSSVASLAWQLSQNLGRPVLDRTGIQGDYDFMLKWTPTPDEGRPEALGLAPHAGPPAPSDSNGPSLFTALQEQLGLKLESTKGPVDTLLVGHVERPSEN